MGARFDVCLHNESDRRRPPFWHPERAELERRILHDAPELPAALDATAQDFILRLLERDPAKRLGSPRAARPAQGP